MKKVYAQIFDLSELNNLLEQRNRAFHNNNLNEFNNYQKKINNIFDSFNLTGLRNIKLQIIKKEIDEGYQRLLDTFQRTKPGFTPELSSSLPFGKTYSAFAKDLIDEATLLSSSKDSEEIKKNIFLILNSKHPDILISSYKENLFEEIKKINPKLNLSSETYKTTFRTTFKNIEKPTLSDKDLIVEKLKSANNYSNLGQPDDVIRLKKEIERIFDRQPTWKMGLNPKLKEAHDRIIRHLDTRIDFAKRKNKNPKLKSEYEFPYNTFDYEPFVKDLIQKAKNQLDYKEYKPTDLDIYKSDVKTRLDWLIQTGHSDILTSELNKKDLNSEIEKQLKELKLPIKASLSNINKVITALENKNFYIEADQLNKILIKIASSINSR